ncbi:protein phosphatase 1 regulatory subunit 21 isoform X2 [Coccinella septempunctata]|uniref:protein phosphatase 1 regulatory subunit 21 isoform X2 n=1 Tax=Coccinella septempunctata TaxID=41139 RepID=UPI001D074765|nr:protein phosphatase 1 regulatory subunit 21 isoform X2 [Coccinella septempunctata]
MDKENSSELEVKYQKLATEFSKIRTHATVLKKALLEEQAKTAELKDVIKKHEQQLRKHNQEMDSLMFRNEQLSKRIAVLQQELQPNNKKGKQKGNNDLFHPPDMTVINEELQKKIMENAQLLSSMTDKDLEINDCREKIKWLENKIQNFENKYEELEKNYSDIMVQMKNQTSSNKQISQNDLQPQITVSSSRDSEEDNDESKRSKYWQEEAERWKAECELLRSKPTSNEQLTEYYESQLREMLETKQMCLSETKTLWAENTALCQKLENLLLENREIESQLEVKKEELHTTNQNYKVQLDAMTEHLAAQNDKITQQSDEIEMLKHTLLSKK